LSGYEIDIESENSAPAEEIKEDKKTKTPGKLKKKSDLENSLLEAIEEHGE
jgi:hypothetical protein